MKQIIFILLFSMGLTSCSNRDQTGNKDISGEWVYRSVLNIPDENVPFCTNDSTGCTSELEFATALMMLQSSGDSITGELDMGEYGKLELTGNFVSENSFRITGTGLKGTNTDGWIYDYFGYTVPMWENGVNQKNTLVGSVIRTADHGNAKKGKVASFYLVKK